MNVDRDARMAALRRNQKENFVGADVKKARRISEMRERQKEKRRSVWNQGREGLDLCEEDEENAAQAKAVSTKGAAPTSDRKQMLLQWKKKRDEQLLRNKAKQPKPFKVGSRNVAAAVPLPAASKPIVSKASRQQQQERVPRRSVRASTAAQRNAAKENGVQSARATRAKGKASQTTVKPAASQPSATVAPTRPALASFNFHGRSATDLEADKFTTLFPKTEFSPFQFKFCMKLETTDLVTVRGERTASPPSGLATADSPALWPQTPAKDGSQPASATLGSGRRSRCRTPVSCRKVRPLHIATAITSSSDGDDSDHHAMSPGEVVIGKSADNDSCTAVESALDTVSLSSPEKKKLSSLVLSVSPPPTTTVATHGETSADSVTTSGRVMPSHSAASSEAAPEVTSAPFRRTMQKTAEELDSMAGVWEVEVEELRSTLPDEILGRIDTAIGQARLLIRERFKQFSKLCDGADDPTAERATHASDLEGFWEMIGFQIEDVKQKFASLATLKANQWQEVGRKTPKKTKAKGKRIAKKKTPAKAAAAARERMRQFRAAKKLELQAAAAAEENSTSSAAEASTPEADPTCASPLQMANPSCIAEALCHSPEVTPLASARRTPASAIPRRKSLHISVKKQTPLAMQPVEAGFDFSKYIEPADDSSPMAVWQTSKPVSSIRDDLMNFSPVASITQVPMDSPVGAFTQSLAPITPANRRRSKVTSIGGLNNHIVMTPVRRSLRLAQTPGNEPVGLSALGALPDLAEYSVWPNPALDN